MNPTEISYAQLHASKFYTVETIDKLIEALGEVNLDAYYNSETRSIDIEIGDNDPTFMTSVIKTTLKNWIYGLQMDVEITATINNNIDFIFNITKINSDDKIIFKVYLY